MGVAGFLTEHGAQAETQGGVEAGGADAAFLQRDGLALPVFHEELAVVGACQGVGREAGCGLLVYGVEEEGVCGGEGRHWGRSLGEEGTR